MKSRSVSLVIILLTCIISCENPEFPKDPFSIDNVEYGSCKTNLKSDIDEYILLVVKNDYYIAASHINSMFNCVPGQIIVESTLDGDIISINEYETEGLANCICPYDLAFTVGPLQYGKYTVVIKKAGLDLTQFDITFSSKMDIRIDIPK